MPSSYAMPIGSLSGVKAHKATGPDEVLTRQANLVCIDGCALGWIRSFLNDRDQTVSLEGK